MKAFRRFFCLAAAVLAALSVFAPGVRMTSASARSSRGSVPIDDYVLVSMTHDDSCPARDYPPEYFHAEYVARVETISSYREGTLTDKETFTRCEALYLTETGKQNIDFFLAELNAREDICVAERDFEYCAVWEEPPGPAAPTEPERGVPIDDYVTVCMTHAYSFPATPHTPAYFNAKFVERIEPVLTYHQGDFWEDGGFCLVERLYLTELGKECIDGFLPELNVRRDILYAGRDYLIPYGDGPLGFVPGDADRNGAVEPADARLALRRTVKLEPCLREDIARCDMDGDEALTPADARLILRLSVGKNGGA